MRAASSQRTSPGICGGAKTGVLVGVLVGPVGVGVRVGAAVRVQVGVPAGAIGVRVRVGEGVAGDVPPAERQVELSTTAPTSFWLCGENALRPTQDRFGCIR